MRYPHRIALTLCALAAALFAMSAFDVAERTDREVRVADVAGGGTPPGPASDGRRPTVEATQLQLLERTSAYGWSGLATTGMQDEKGSRGRPVASEGARRGRAPRSAVEEVAHPPDSPPYFDPILVAPDTVSVGITGVDPLGPRRLVLWRLSGDTVSRLGETQSDRRQRFDFGQVLVPSRGLTLAVTPAGEAFRRPPASYLVDLDLLLSAQAGIGNRSAMFSE